MSGKWLVIDACVISSAGRKDDPQSSCCREFLIWVYRKQHHVVMSAGLCSEWRRHGSGITTKWRKAMKEKGKLHMIRCHPDEELREAITSTQYLAVNDGALSIVIEDTHLIELSFKTDKTIVSLDEQVREHFKNISKTVVCLKVIVWVNPAIDTEEPIEWLKTGANPDEHRKLGYTVQRKTIYWDGHKLRKEKQSPKVLKR